MVFEIVSYEGGQSSDFHDKSSSSSAIVCAVCDCSHREWYVLALLTGIETKSPYRSLALCR